MKFFYRRRLVVFLKKYRLAKERAKDFMKQGDLNNYLKTLIESEKTRQKATTMLTQDC